ncbi:uncharacterized protein LOC122026716 [Zingiber officinale]|uniref:uncharacterized protein LOC122026716 n=1 Tax=Zingiber officinale TaxID=94328 RepID=UPI001C4C0A09|nr:uncharacterized protein LOC122026716 [Zingiber officinale]
MAEGNMAPWYSYYISDLDDSDLAQIQESLHLTTDYQLCAPRPTEHPSSPPKGFVTFFKDQLLGGLRFPLHPIFSSLSQYFRIPLSQFTPNVIRAICGMVILYRVYQIPLTAELFHHFYSLKRSEPDVFMVQSRVGCKFFSDMPSSNKESSTPLFLSAVPYEAGPATLKLIEEERATSPPSDKRLRLQRKRKRVAPSVQASPLHPPERASSKLPKVQVLTPRVPAQESPQVAEVPTLTPIRVLAPEQADPSAGDQPGSSATPSSIPTASSPSAARTRGRSQRNELDFIASWCLPSEAESNPTRTSVEADVPPVRGRIHLQGELAALWRSTNEQFREGSRWGSLDLASRHIISACSSGLCLTHFAANLLQEIESLKARIQESELPLTPRDPFDPLDSYLYAVRESTQSARKLVQESTKKIKELQAALQASYSKLNLKDQCRHQLADELKEKDSKLAALTVDLKALQESNKLIQKDLEVARADLVASADREKIGKTQHDRDQATIKSLKADLLKAQAEASTLKQEKALALASTEEVRVELVEYRSGEGAHLEAYRLSYIKSPMFQEKIFSPTGCSAMGVREQCANCLSKDFFAPPP